MTAPSVESSYGASACSATVKWVDRRVGDLDYRDPFSVCVWPPSASRETQRFNTRPRRLGVEFPGIMVLTF